ncbi:exported hypothetical protein [Acidobacteriia bacterium SbA2]|nr:exported hypothetical protein [Acidobacteriia bacterium SbA2]
MKRAAGGVLVSLLIVAAIIWFVVKPQFTHGPEGGASPKQMIDVVGVKTDLVVIGKAEQLYLAVHGSYASLEQLEQDGEIAFSGTGRRGYNYTAEVNDGLHFKITAVPSAPDKQGWPTLWIDQSMQVAQQ